MKKIGFTVTLFLVLGLVLAACAAPQKPAPVPEKPAAASPTPSAPQLTRDQQLIEGAKKEGEVVLWTHSWQVGGPAQKAFEAKYPSIKLTVWDASRATNAIARLAEEAKIGRHPADVVIFPDVDFVALAEMGLHQQYEGNNKGWPSQPSNKQYINIADGAYFPMYNTDLVSAAEAPKSFNDLKSSKWRGRAAISSSGRSIPLLTAYIMGQEKVDFEKAETFWNEVVTNTRPRLMSGYDGPLGLLAAGEFAILLMSASSTATEMMWRGAPLAGAALEAAPTCGHALGLLKDAPHPNAARLLIDFFTSPEGNLAYANDRAIIALSPEAATKARANRYYDGLGIKILSAPADLNTPENSARSSRYWSLDMPRLAGSR
ncbi:MAG: iron transporter substrate-binding protein [Dehalococcoidia bacterium]|nr:iron transporter substrate-binding protein [Dehalococcoidia bacterium]